MGERRGVDGEITDPERIIDPTGPADGIEIVPDADPEAVPDSDAGVGTDVSVGTDVDVDVDGDEFADVDEVDEPTQRIDWDTLRQPQVIQAFVALVGSLAVLVWPDLADRTVAALLGIVVGLISLIWLFASLRDRRPANAGLALLGVLAAAFVLAARRTPDEALVLLVGAGAIAVGLRRLVSAIGERLVDRILSALLLVGCGLLAVAFPAAVFQVTLLAIAAGAGLFAVVAIAASLDPTVDGVASMADSDGLVRTWLASRHKEADDRRALYDKILYEGPTTRRRIARFTILMSFAAVIASMGVVTDSTAVVIGAMLIAPLMTPLMGTAISLIMGWPARLRRSAIIAVGGVLLAITIGMIIGALVPTEIDTLANGQITGRSNPTTLDLITALAAGAAGAYGLSRPDVSDALPGVAIAISLVPPLTVVGISYSQGDVRSGNGALLLFITNMLAILIMGGITFVLTGVTPLARLTDQQHRLRTWAATVAVAAVVVIGALALNGAEIARNTFEQSRVETMVAEWMEPAELFATAQVGIDGDMVTVVVVGPDEGLPAAQPLADDLSMELGRAITVDVRHVVEQRVTVTGSG
ncbi:MAG: DUF389 domain-containing protein [Actinomycetota bacterium]